MRHEPSRSCDQDVGVTLHKGRRLGRERQPGSGNRGPKTQGGGEGGEHLVDLDGQLPGGQNHQRPQHIPYQPSPSSTITSVGDKQSERLKRSKYCGVIVDQTPDLAYLMNTEYPYFYCRRQGPILHPRMQHFCSRLSAHLETQDLKNGEKQLCVTAQNRI
jgi:hypothetical protein